jgi:hypothetical protein
MLLSRVHIQLIFIYPFLVFYFWLEEMSCDGAIALWDRLKVYYVQADLVPLVKPRGVRVVQMPS